VSVKAVIRATLKGQQDLGDRFSKIIAVLASGAFNMKGQELEQVLGVLIHEYLETMGVAVPKVDVPQAKSGPDLAFGLPGTVVETNQYSDLKGGELQSLLREKGLAVSGNNGVKIERLEWADEHSGFVDLKFYGGSHRTQLSTLQGKKNIDDIKNKFERTQDRNLPRSHKQWLANKISGIDIDYTLGIYYTTDDDGRISIDVFDFENLDISGLIEYQSARKNSWKLMRVHTDNHIEIHIGFNDLYLEISTGKNAYNRGMWINQIKNSDDLDELFPILGIERVFATIKIPPTEFDPQLYVRSKGEACLNFVDQLFNDGN
jgi:hypothetical protein